MSTRETAGYKVLLGAFLPALLAALVLVGCSEPAQDSAAPVAGAATPSPIVLSASAASTSTINLSWSTFTGNLPTTGYRIYRGGTQLVVVGNVTTYLDTGLNAGTAYVYTVEAIDTAGNPGGLSAAAIATTGTPDTTAPTTPAGLTATSFSSSQINLSWTAATDNVAVTGYGIYRDGALITVSANTTTYQDTGLNQSTTYTYNVDAVDAAGNTSIQSLPASATTATPDTTPPSIPTGLTATAISASRIDLSWTASTDNVGVTGYIIRRDGSILNTAGNVTTFQNTGLTQSTTYSYTVEAIDADGNASGQSASASATTATIDTTAPSTPTGLAASAVSSSQINLSWTASTDNVAVTGYRIRRGGALLVTLGNVTTYQNTGLAPSTTYAYTVQAFDAAGNSSAQSTAASATTQATLDTTPPTIPGGLTASAVSSTQINLSWSASTDDVAVTGYRVYRGGTLLSTVPGNVTAFQNTGLTPSTTYSYTVDAVDAAGNASGQTSAASATTPAPGAISVSLAAARTSGVAPLAVFFDASGTTDSGTSRPFHELEYRWDFGDAAGSPVSGTTWNTGSGAGANSRNAARGPMAAHVFESPGNYTVTLFVSNGASTSSANVLITVLDPNVVFSNTNTRCFSTSGTFTDCPAGATTVTTSDFDSAISGNIGTGRRLLFRRGETFQASAPSSIKVTGPGIVGAYGSSGAKPVIQAVAGSLASDNGIVMFSSSTTPTMKDWRIMDLQIDGASRSTTGIYEDGGVDQVTLLRLDIHHLRWAIGFNDGILDYYNSNGKPGHHVFDQIAVADCTTRNILGVYSYYGAAKHFALLGNDFNNNGTGSHVVRITYTDTAAISNNTVTGASTTEHNLKLQAMAWTQASVDNPGGVGTYSQSIVISDNKFVGSGEQWSEAIGPEDNAVDERVRQLIFERNWFTGSANNVTMLQIWSKETTIRNNLFDATGMGSHEPLYVTRRGGSGQMTPTDVWVYNNTFYSSDASNDFTAINLDSVVTNVTIKNNLAYAPNDSSHAFKAGNGASGVVATNNSTNAQVGSTSPGFASATPSVPADFKLNAGSYAINAGATVPVFSDFFLTTRPQNGLFEMGFMERP
jgi:chitodextrinase